MRCAQQDGTWHRSPKTRPVFRTKTCSPGARLEARVILTEDKDFGELVFRMKRGVPGIIMIRLPQGAWHTRWARIRSTLESRADRLLEHYTVISEQTVRARRMPAE